MEARGPAGIHLQRRHPQAEEFRRAWDAALDIALCRIEDVAMDRALNGVEQPLYCHGEIFGHRTFYNDRLLMFMLRNRAPERFGGGLSNRRTKGPNAVDRMELNRLKAQWHKDWKREQFAQSVHYPSFDRLPSTRQAQGERGWCS